MPLSKHAFICDRCLTPQEVVAAARAEGREVLHDDGWWGKGPADLCPECVRWAKRFVKRKRLTVEERRHALELDVEYGLLEEPVV